jgi:hypothetical protein
MNPARYSIQPLPTGFNPASPTSPQQQCHLSSCSCNRPYEFCAIKKTSPKSPKCKIRTWSRRPLVARLNARLNAAVTKSHSRHATHASKRPPPSAPTRAVRLPSSRGVPSRARTKSRARHPDVCCDDVRVPTAREIQVARTWQILSVWFIVFVFGFVYILVFLV